MSALAAILFLAVLIIIHELGHFWAARAFNIKCTEFAVGFGPTIISKQIGEVRYAWRAVPLGGFVRIIGMDDSEEIPPDVLGPHEMHRAYFNAAPWKRAIVLFAGPAANLVLPLFIYTAMFSIPHETEASVVGYVIPGQPGQLAGLMAGDRITSVEGEPVATFSGLRDVVAARPGQPTRLTVDRAGKSVELTLTPGAVTARDRFGGESTVGRIGITPYFPRVDIGIPATSTVAWQAGLRTWDRIVAVNGNPVAHFPQFEAMVAAGLSGDVAVEYERPQDVSRKGLESGPRVKGTATLTIAGRAERLQELGIERADLYVVATDEGSPAAGVLRPGDRIVSIGAIPVTDMHMIAEALRAKPDEAQPITWSRDGQMARGEISLWKTSAKGPGGVDVPEIRPGFFTYIDMSAAETVQEQFGPVESVQRAATTTWQMITGTLYGVYLLFAGRVPSESVGGPILLFQIAKESASTGFEAFLGMMSIISINLGLLNLFPVPLLDGGHLTLLAVESLRRRPFTPQVRNALNLVGLVLLLSLFLFSTKNDVFRLIWSSGS